MKAIVLSIVLFICGHGLFAQSNWDSIYAVVNQNHVEIHQDNAEHNCGFMPELNHITITKDSVINWYQVDTIGMFYGCECIFDYSLDIDSLNPGNYTVLVYSAYNTEFNTDTTYEGSTTFSIEEPAICDSIFQLTSTASLCHEYTGLKDYPSVIEQYFIQTNSYNISVTSKGTKKIFKVVLSNISGQEVLNRVYNSVTEIQLPTTSLKKGIYILSIYDNNNSVVNRKIFIFN